MGPFTHKNCQGTILIDKSQSATFYTVLSVIFSIFLGGYRKREKNSKFVVYKGEEYNLTKDGITVLFRPSFKKT